MYAWNFHQTRNKESSIVRTTVGGLHLQIVFEVGVHHDKQLDVMEPAPLPPDHSSSVVLVTIYTGILG